MKINPIEVKGFLVNEIVSDNILIKTPQDVLDLLGEVGFSDLVLYEHNFESEFFDLSTKKLGEILQKFTNYKVKVAIIGDFQKYSSKILQQFIYESNRVGNYLFLNKIEEVIEKWNLKE